MAKFFNLEIMHLNFIEGTDLLNVIQISKQSRQKYHGTSPLWKFIYDNEFGIPRCPCCKLNNFRHQYVINKRLLEDVDY